MSPFDFPNYPIALRPLTSQHLSDFMKWAKDDEVTKTLTWNSYTDPEAAFSFLKNVAEKHSWLKAIYLDETVIGSISLEKKVLFGEEVVEVGYVIARDYWGLGYATVALRLAISRCLEELKISKIVAFVDPEHVVSQKVLEKNGFIFQGKLPKLREIKNELKDRLYYSLIVSKQDE